MSNSLSTLIPTLSKYQVNHLEQTVNSGFVMFAVVEATDMDTTAKYEEIARNMSEMQDLIRLGLITDVSDKFRETIEATRINKGRGFRMFAVTENGIRMFEKKETNEKGTIN